MTIKCLYSLHILFLMLKVSKCEYLLISYNFNLIFKFMMWRHLTLIMYIYIFLLKFVMVTDWDVILKNHMFAKPWFLFSMHVQYTLNQKEYFISVKLMFTGSIHKINNTNWEQIINNYPSFIYSSRINSKNRFLVH